MCEQIEEILMEVEEKDSLVILGDWNAVVGKGRYKDLVIEFRM